MLLSFLEQKRKNKKPIKPSPLPFSFLCLLIHTQKVKGSMDENREGRRSGVDGGGHMVANVENGRNPRLEEIANIFLPIIIQSVANIMAIDEAQLSTTGRVMRSLSMVINLLGFICCCVAVLWPPNTNRGAGRRWIPKIPGISRIGSALAVLGFVSMMAINLPLYLSWIMYLAFLVLLVIFLVDISEARTGDEEN